jgi:hypothetical protein
MLESPDGPWGPESHIQRGAITYDFMVPGDPLTPGWESVPGAKRIPFACLKRLSILFLFSTIACAQYIPVYAKHRWYGVQNSHFEAMKEEL